MFENPTDREKVNPLSLREQIEAKEAHFEGLSKLIERHLGEKMSEKQIEALPEEKLGELLERAFLKISPEEALEYAKEGEEPGTIEAFQRKMKGLFDDYKLKQRLSQQITDSFKKLE